MYSAMWRKLQRSRSSTGRTPDLLQRHFETRENLRNYSDHKVAINYYLANRARSVGRNRSNWLGIPENNKISTTRRSNRRSRWCEGQGQGKDKEVLWVEMMEVQTLTEHPEFPRGLSLRALKREATAMSLVSSMIIVRKTVGA